jgi:hypothetical protein
MLRFLRNLFRRPTPAAVTVLGASTADIPIYPWFGVINTDELEQGDIFENCPVYFPPADLGESPNRAIFKWGELDLIVLSQSCDLVRGREEGPQVSLCAIWRQSEFKAGHKFADVSNLERVRKGQIPRYHLIARSDLSGFEREIRVVDLQPVYSLPVAFLRRRALMGKRLRLLPPYREHLSQSFARSFMRVGLPIDIPPFTKNKK